MPRPFLGARAARNLLIGMAPAPLASFAVACPNAVAANTMAVQPDGKILFNVPWARIQRVRLFLSPSLRKSR